MGRFFRWLKALFHRQMDTLEDPDLMLDEARREMQEGLASNREKAVQAITQKNRLQSMVDEATKKSILLEQQAGVALKQGNREAALVIMREKTANEQTLESLKTTLAQAAQTVESVKLAIKHQEEEVRAKTAEALAMKAQWKQAQIQKSISIALEGLSTENQFESFGRASERIKEAQSESAARQELASESVQGKIMQVQSTAMDYTAEEELRKLEEKLGMSSPGTTEMSTEEKVISADEQLQQLEQKLNQGQSEG